MQPVAPSNPSGDDSSADRFYDLSLRILMVVVSVGLVASVAFLTYRWLAPPRPAQVEVPMVEIGVKQPPAAPQPVPKQPTAEVLMNPGQIFKCEVNGRITFSEQPCTAAGANKKSEKSVAAAKESAKATAAAAEPAKAAPAAAEPAKAAPAAAEPAKAAPAAAEPAKAAPAAAEPEKAGAVVDEPVKTAAPAKEPERAAAAAKEAEKPDAASKPGAAN